MCATWSQCGTKCHPSLLLLCIFSIAEIYPKVYHICFFIATYCAPLCLMVLAYIQICHKLWFQQVCNSSSLQNTSACTCSAPNHLFMYVHIWWTRYLEARRCCRGSGDPWSVPLRLRAWLSPPGSGRVQLALRSNRSELVVRRPGCWWWFSLSSPCATCQSACWMSWKGNLSRAPLHPRSKTMKQLCDAHLSEPGLKCPKALSHMGFFCLLHVALLIPRGRRPLSAIGFPINQRQSLIPFESAPSQLTVLLTCRVFGTFKNTNDRETVYAWFTFSHWLIYANSAANPIIYNFLSGKFEAFSCFKLSGLDYCA